MPIPSAWTGGIRAAGAFESPAPIMRFRRKPTCHFLTQKQKRADARSLLPNKRPWWQGHMTLRGGGQAGGGGHSMRPRPWEMPHPCLWGSEMAAVVTSCELGSRLSQEGLCTLLVPAVGALARPPGSLGAYGDPGLAWGMPPPWQQVGGSLVLENASLRGASPEAPACPLCACELQLPFSHRPELMLMW